MTTSIKTSFKPRLVTFRPIRYEDMPYRYNWYSDAEVVRHLGTHVRKGMTLAAHRAWFRKRFKDDDRRQFVILYDKEPIGTVGLGHINRIDKNAELYLAIGNKDFWGLGISQIALKFITNYGFKRFKLHRIYLTVHADNPRAISAYQKFGFKQEGLLKDSYLEDGQFKDELTMALFNPN